MTNNLCMATCANDLYNFNKIMLSVMEKVYNIYESFMLNLPLVTQQCAQTYDNHFKWSE